VHALRVARGSNAKFAKVAKKIHLGVLRVLGVLVLFVACSGGTGLFKLYEYEEEMYLSLDGTATLYVNSSLAAMNALLLRPMLLPPAAVVSTACTWRAGQLWTPSSVTRRAPRAPSFTRTR